MQPVANKIRRISVLTSSRAEYGHLFWTLRAICQHPALELDLIVCGTHLDRRFGNSIEQIEQDGFEINFKIESQLGSDSDVATAKNLALTSLSLSDYFANHRPDLLLLIADRYEMLAPASVALCLRIPIAHIEGGDVSRGAIDDQVRNALTKMAQIHFAPSHTCHQRIAAMGEEPWRIHTVGALSLDHLRYSPLPSRNQLEAKLGFVLSAEQLMCCMHPVTLSADPAAEFRILLGALKQVEYPVIFCFPNADTGYAELVETAEQYCQQHDSSRLLVNLEHTHFWRLMRECRALIGNSSAGIMESPSIPLATINIGERQWGREMAANILSVEAEENAILTALKWVGSESCVEALKTTRNPYDCGQNAGKKIATVLASVNLGETLLHKQPMFPA